MPSKVNIGVVIENLLVVILGAATGRFGFRDISSGVIQILAVLLFCAYSYIAAATSETNSREKFAAGKGCAGRDRKGSRRCLPECGCDETRNQ